MTDVNNVISLWRAFRAFAVHQVREGFETERPNGCRSRSLLAVLHEPAFADVVGWQIQQVTCGDQDPQYIAHRTLWKLGDDYLRIANPIDRLAILRQKYLGFPIPTLEYIAVVPDADFVAGIVERIGHLCLPLSLDLEHSGTNRTHYQLCVGQFPANTVLRWWGEAPAEWAEAGAIVMETLGHLEALYEERKSPP